jgi:hypothetical protein
MEKVHIGVEMCDEEILTISLFVIPCCGWRTMV